jgi:hypothetical protein
MQVYWGGRRAAPVVLNHDTTRQLNVPAAITRYKLDMRLGWMFLRYRTIQGCLFEPEVVNDVSVRHFGVAGTYQRLFWALTLSFLSEEI